MVLQIFSEPIIVVGHLRELLRLPRRSAEGRSDLPTKVVVDRAPARDHELTSA